MPRGISGLMQRRRCRSIVHAGIGHPLPTSSRLVMSKRPESVIHQHHAKSCRWRCMWGFVVLSRMRRADRQQFGTCVLAGLLLAHTNSLLAAGSWGVDFCVTRSEKADGSLARRAELKSWPSAASSTMYLLWWSWCRKSSWSLCHQACSLTRIKAELS